MLHVVELGNSLVHALLATPPVALSPASHTHPVRELAGTAFLPLGGADRLPQLAQDGGVAWLVRTELPRERLGLLGLPFDPARAGDRVPAELLLNPSGEVLAVRIVP